MNNKIKEYIEIIQQLGADARYYNDLENIGQLKVIFESIVWYAKKSQKILEKEGEEYE